MRSIRSKADFWKSRERGAAHSAGHLTRIVSHLNRDVFYDLRRFSSIFCRHQIIIYLVIAFITLNYFSVGFNARAQQSPYSTYSSPMMGSQYTTPGAQQPSSSNYLKNSAAFRQEIMKMEINVVRGNQTLPITQVPRVQKDDVITMHLLEEAAGGIKPNESMWNWTFLVAFVNPNRKSTEASAAKGGTVSEEIQFRKTGWYKDYSFKVPYDSQPVFFLYPKPKYRSQILKLVNKKYEEVRELGDKTIELANAYSRIDNFLTELQSVLYRTQSSYYGNFVTYPVLPGTTTNGTSTYNPYGTSSTYNPYGTTTTYNPFGTTTSTYNPYGTTSIYGTTTGTTPNALIKPPDPIYNYNAFFEQTVERLAASFNLNLPSCWQTNNGGYNYFGTPGGGYGSVYGGTSSYGSSYGTSYGSTYGSTTGIGGGNGPNSFGHAVSSEFIGRAQCVAKGIRMEDFDFSVGKLLQEGGIFALTQLRDKYPQLAYYINLAAVAIEFIVKVFQKYPMKIVPTLIQTSDGKSFGATTNNGTNPVGNNGGSSGGYNGGSFSASASNPNGTFSPSIPPGSSLSSGSSASLLNPVNYQPVKISVYAESQPSDTDTVTAYPVVVHKWQSEPDPEVITLTPPVPLEPCLHAGVNLLKSTDITKDDSADTFTKDFKLSVSSGEGFQKDFPLKKNLGAGGWELTLTNEDLNSFPKTGSAIEAEITGTRGFNEVRSPKFALPINTGGSWRIEPESQKAFAVGARRTITLQNATGTCRCLQAVIYKPSFGGQFVFETNAKNPANQLQYSADGKSVSFDIDATNFQQGTGTLEMKTYGDNQPPGVPGGGGSSGQPGSQLTSQQVSQPNSVNNQTGFGGQNNQGGQSNQNQSSNILSIKLYPLPPNVTKVKMARGDNQAIISGERLEQIQYVNINGKRATLVGGSQALRGGGGSAVPNSNGIGMPGAQPGNPMNGQMSAQPNAMMGAQPNPIGASTGSPMNNQTGGSSGNPFASPSGNQPNNIMGGQPANQVGGQTSGQLPLPGNPSQLLTGAAPSVSPLSYSSLAPGERLAVFADAGAVLTDTDITLELGLEDSRLFQVPQSFPSSASRPAIEANADHEVEGSALAGSPSPATADKALNGTNPASNSPAVTSLSGNSSLSLAGLPVFPIATREIAVRAQNIRTDYEFKPEDLSIETRIENGGTNSSYGNPEIAKASFEVFDWKSMRVNLSVSEQGQKLLGGRRLQFRLRDRERGDSDWYTVRQTFVRMPEIKAVKCTTEMKGQCELKGNGIDYISQISTDGGKTWYPGDGTSLQTQSQADGTITAMIPHYANRNLLMIKLRDFPGMSGIVVNNYSFVNSAKEIVIKSGTIKKIIPKTIDSAPSIIPLQISVPIPEQRSTRKLKS